MKIFFYLYGLFYFFLMTIYGVLSLAHIHALIGYEQEVLIDDLDYDELDAMVEEKLSE